MVKRIEKGIRNKKIYRNDDGKIVYSIDHYEILRIPYNDGSYSMSAEDLFMVLNYIKIKYGKYANIGLINKKVVDDSNKFENYPSTSYLGFIIEIISERIDCGGEIIYNTNAYLQHETVYDAEDNKNSKNKKTNRIIYNYTYLSIILIPH